jgi:predicted MFS family arabinose efflux permease
MDARVKDSSELSFILLLKQFGQLWYNQALLICSVVMLLESVVFGAVTTFLPLYAVQSGQGNAGIYLMLQAGVVVIIRFTLRKKIPSDGKWHTGLIVGLLLVAALGALMLAVTAKAGPVDLYASAVLLGTAMALIYPTIMTYLTFTLPSSSRNVLIGLFIATADLGISLGGMLMGLVADYLSYSAMYAVCSMLSLTAALVALSSGRRMNTYQSQ